MMERVDILAELQALKARVAELESQAAGRGRVFPLPAAKGSNQLRLITMARTDPEAAKAEALRLARKDTTTRRKGA